MIKLLPTLADQPRWKLRDRLQPLPWAAMFVQCSLMIRSSSAVRPCLLPETVQPSPETIQTLTVHAVYLRHRWLLAAARPGLMEVDGQSQWRWWVIYNSPTQVAWDLTVASTSYACPACAGRLWPARCIAIVTLVTWAWEETDHFHNAWLEGIVVWPHCLLHVCSDTSQMQHCVWRFHLELEWHVTLNGNDTCI